MKKFLKNLVIMGFIGLGIANPSHVFAAEQIIKQDSECLQSVDPMEEDNNWDSDKMYEQYVADLFKSENDDDKICLYNSTSGSQLTGLSKSLYDYLSTKFEEIIAGKCVSTEFYIPADLLLDTPEIYPSKYGLNEFTVDNYGAAAQLYLSELYSDFLKSLSAFHVDKPYELFWYDKSKGMELSYTYDLYSDKIKIKNLIIRINVVKKYQGTSQYSVNSNTVSVADYAKYNALDIVKQAEGLPDLDKIRFYRDTIVSECEYNFEVSNDNSTGDYGDPFQLIYVFDRDPSTNVVCEGFAKAFQYLMDETTFSNDQIYSYILRGYLNNGNHMWNMVHLDDGENYLVDITNSGRNLDNNQALRFIQPAESGNIEDGYKFARQFYSTNGVTQSNSNALYKYYSELNSIYSKEQLTVSMSEYKHSHTFESDCDSLCDVCGETRNVSASHTFIDSNGTNPFYEKCSKCHVLNIGYVFLDITGKNITYNGEYQSGKFSSEVDSKYYTVINNKPQKNAGYYNITIEGKGLYAGTRTISWTINPYPVTLSITGNNAYKSYDGTTALPEDHNLAIKPLNGLIPGDDIQFTADFQYEDADAGQNKTIIASNFTATGTEKANYVIKNKTATCNVGYIDKLFTTVSFSKPYNPSKNYDGAPLENPTATDLELSNATYDDVQFNWYKDSIQEENKLSKAPVTAGKYILLVSVGETKNTYASKQIETDIIEIKKIDPDISDLVPESINALCGDMLAYISLPKSFKWMDETTQLEANKEFKTNTTAVCYAQYIPKDTTNYNIISNIPIKLNISHNIRQNHIDNTNTHQIFCKSCQSEFEIEECSKTKATCVQDEKCSDCGYIYNYADKTKHDLEIIEASIEPTCKTAGKECVKKCKNCSYTEGGEEIPTLPHTPDDEFTLIQEATCLQYGLLAKQCTVCHKPISLNFLPKADHIWNNGVVTKEATQKSNGIIVYTCTVCGTEREESISYNSNNIENSSEADNTPTLPSENTPESDHNNPISDSTENTNSDDINKPSSDVAENTSSDDNNKPSSDATDNTNSDDNNKPSSDATDNASSDDNNKPSSDKTESTTASNSNIKEDSASTAESVKNMDEFVDNTNTIKYRVIDANNMLVEVLSLANEKATSITIPNVISYKDKQYTVSQIHSKAFYKNTKLTKIVISDSITNIGNNTFYDCKKLKSIKLGKNLTTIEANTFRNCKALTSLKIPYNVSTIGNNAFYGCKKIKKLTINSKKLTSKTVAKKAFKGLSKKTIVKVPKTKKKAYTTLLRKKGLTKAYKIK